MTNLGEDGMKKFLFSVIRIFASWLVGLTTLGVVYFSTDVSFLLSLIIGVGGYYVTSLVLKRKFRKAIKVDVNKEKQLYRLKELRHARLKIYKIGKYRYKIRSVYMWQTISKIHKMLQKMVAVAEREPERFRNVQSFFNTYLDSLTMILDKYTVLTNQQVKNQDILLAIKKTEETLEEMAKTLEENMLAILENDVIDLDVELKVLKQSLDKTANLANLDYPKIKGE